MVISDQIAVMELLLGPEIVHLIVLRAITIIEGIIGATRVIGAAMVIGTTITTLIKEDILLLIVASQEIIPVMLPKWRMLQKQ